MSVVEVTNYDGVTKIQYFMRKVAARDELTSELNRWWKSLIDSSEDINWLEIGQTERGARYVQARRTWSGITKRLAVTGTSECGLEVSGTESKTDSKGGQE